jgi:hypothetical protein
LADLDALLALRKPCGARILDLETKVRETYGSLFSVSGDEIFKQKALDQLVSSRLEFIKSTRVYKDATDIHAANDHPPGPLGAQEIHAHDTLNEDSLAVHRATANLRKNTISLSHTTIAEEIQKHVAEAGLADFTTTSLQATVLLHCIQNLCIDETSQDQQTVELARRYCGLFLPEHLHSVKPSEVAEYMRTRIGKGLIALLRNPQYISRWVESAERYLADDLLGKPDFHQRILEWLEDDIVQSVLNDDEREWHSRAKQSPIATLFGGMAKAVAHRWLACLEGWYAYADYYGFLKTIQVSVAQYVSSSSFQKSTLMQCRTSRTARRPFIQHPRLQVVHFNLHPRQTYCASQSQQACSKMAVGSRDLGLRSARSELATMMLYNSSQERLERIVVA